MHWGRSAWVLAGFLGVALAPACGTAFTAAPADAGAPDTGAPDTGLTVDGANEADAPAADAGQDVEAGPADAAGDAPPATLACGSTPCPFPASACCVEAPPPPADAGTMPPFTFACEAVGASCPGPCDTLLDCSDDADCLGKPLTPLCCIAAEANASCASATGRYVASCRASCAGIARMCDPKSSACSLSGGTKSCKDDVTTLAPYGLPANGQYGICE